MSIMAKGKLAKWITKLFGKIGKGQLAYRSYKGQKKIPEKETFHKTVIEPLPKPRYTRTEKQAKVRNAYRQAVYEWKTMNPEEKWEWRRKALGTGLSGYHLYMKYRIKELLAVTMNYEITIDNSSNSSELTDYQVLLIINNDPTFFSDVQDKKYMEFYDSDKTTLLNHFVEEWDDVNHNARIWIKIPSIPANGTKKIYLRINTSRTTDLSNGNNVFDFFDDFEDGVLDTDKWVKEYGVWEEYNGYIHGEGTNEKWDTNTGGAVLRSKQTFDGDFIAVAKVNITSTNGYDRLGVTWYVNDAFYATSKRRWDYAGSKWTQHFAVEANDSNKINSNIEVDINPVYVRLDKIGNTYKAYYSSDGLNWTFIDELEYNIGIPYFALEIDSAFNKTAVGDVLICYVRKYTSPEPTLSYSKL